MKFRCSHRSKAADASSIYDVRFTIYDLRAEKMKRQLTITTERIDEAALLSKRRISDGMGAVVCFLGVVRGTEEDRAISAIKYEAFLRMVEYGREDLVSGRVSWRELTPGKWREADEQALAQLAATGICEPFEKEYFRKDGSRVPVLIGAALLEGRRDEGVAFVLDLTERKLAEETLHKTQAELAHVTRLTTISRRRSRPGR